MNEVRLSCRGCQVIPKIGWVGGQNEGGFGGSPPKIDSHFHAQCRVGGQKQGGVGGSPPKNALPQKLLILYFYEVVSS